MAETSYGRPLPHNIYNALIGRLRDYTSTPGKNAPDSFFRGVVAGSPVGALPTTPEALRMLNTLVGAAFGIPSAYDDINTTMHTVGDAATNPATYTELGRQIGANPAGAGGVALGSLIGLPGPMDDFIGKPTIASKTELKFGKSALSDAERRLASREAIVQRKLVEGYEGKITSTPLWTLPNLTEAERGLKRAERRIAQALTNNNPTQRADRLKFWEYQKKFWQGRLDQFKSEAGTDAIPVGPDWAESPGDMAVRLQRATTENLAAELNLHNDPAVRAELVKRGWRGDIADAEHLALEGPPGRIPVEQRGWTREERGASMLHSAGLADLANNALSPAPANASGWSPEGNILDFLKRNKELHTDPLQGDMVAHKFLAGHMGADPAYITAHLNILGAKAEGGDSFWHAGKRYFKADRGWSLDPEASIAKPHKPEGTGMILPHAPVDLQANIDKWLNDFGPEYASEYAQRAGGVDKDIADFWVSKPITTKILTKQASTEEIVWYNFIRKRYRPSE